VKKSEALQQNSSFVYKIDSDEKEIPCLAQLCRYMDQIHKISKTFINQNKMKKVEVAILKSKQS